MGNARIASLGAGLSGLLVFASCAHPRPAAPAPTISREGTSSVRLLRDEQPPTAPPPPDAPTITPAYASDDNRLPEYPPYALEGGCASGIVPIRVVVGKDGNVAGLKPIPNRPVADDQCHSAFWASTCAAVQRWRFSPAYRQTTRPGPDVDKDGRPDFRAWDQTPVTIYLDFEFTFRVVEGRGEVRSK
jgi:hypothetical protein